MADEDAGVEFGRIDAAGAKFRGPGAPRVVDGSRTLVGGERGGGFARGINSLLGREQRRLILGDQRIDDLAERLAFQDLRQLVERKIDAVVRHAALRIIIGADALGAVAGADLAAALGGARGVLLLPLADRRAACAARPSPWRGCDAASGPPASSRRCPREYASRGPPIRSC